MPFPAPIDNPDRDQSGFGGANSSPTGIDRQGRKIARMAVAAWGPLARLQYRRSAANGATQPLLVIAAVQLVLAPVVIVLADVIFFDREFIEAGDPFIDDQALERLQPVIVVT